MDDVKECFCCGHVKPLGDFYRHSQMADGYMGKCKGCQKANGRKNYWKNLSARKASYRESSQRPGKKAQRAEYLRRWKEKYPKKYKAKNAVSNAIRLGKLQRQACEVCGARKAQAHHEDYDKPLYVQWLCRKHHLEKHDKIAWVD